MYEIKYGNKFRKSYKKILNSGHFGLDNFENILSILKNGEKLPDRYHDHILRGNFSDSYECHISGDCLLIYKIDNFNKYIRLINIGNHANLFE